MKTSKAHYLQTYCIHWQIIHAASCGKMTQTVFLHRFDSTCNCLLWWGSLDLKYIGVSVFMTMFTILFVCVHLKKFTAAHTVYNICNNAQMFITCLLVECGVGITNKKQWRGKGKFKNFHCKEIILDNSVKNKPCGSV